MIGLLTTLFFSTIVNTYGFESFPEFESLTEREEAIFDNPRLSAGEYFSDIISYSKPISWDYTFFSKSLAYDLTAGSLSGDAFYLQNRAKLSAFLLEKNWEFRWTYFEDRTYERDSSHHILELIKWFTPQVGFSLYGEPSRYKRENDLGIAIVFHPSPNHELRIFNTFVDLVRTERNDRTDRFESPDEPQSRGLVGRFHSDPSDPERAEFFEYALRFETYSRWIFPKEMYEYHYSKKLLKLSGQKTIGPKVNVSGRVQWDEKTEEKSPSNPASLILQESWRTHRLMAFLESTREDFESLGKYWALTAGLGHSYRHWTTEGRSARMNDWMPYFKVKIPTSESIERNYWEFEYMFTWHREDGAASLRELPTDDENMESRLNAFYEIPFKVDAYLRLGLTFDLDRLGFEGGVGQFRVNF